MSPLLCLPAPEVGDTDARARAMPAGRARNYGDFGSANTYRRWRWWCGRIARVRTADASSEGAVAARASGEAPRAFLALARVDRRLAERELVGDGRGQRQPETLPRRATIAAHAIRGKLRDRPRQVLGRLARAPCGHDAIGEAEVERLARIHGAAG